MSIFETTNENASRPSRDRALELFTDRTDIIAAFARYLNSDPAPQKIIFLHGVGGNGKSLLLRYLQAKLCFRVPEKEWDKLQLIPDAELALAL
jgi:hypothetical protein